jgi:tRNA(Ile2) C34 agmatinyltransferase TiaS
MEGPVKPVCKDCGAQMVRDFFGDWFCDECESKRMKNPPKLQLLIALLSILAFVIGFALDRE